MSRVKLVATEGMMLTNGEVYGRMVFLATGDSPDNWREIPETEALSAMEHTETEPPIV